MDGNTMNCPTAKILAAAAICAKDLRTLVHSSPVGVPGHYLYAALMGSIPLSTFETLMAEMVKQGVMVKQGHLYYGKEAP